MFIKQTKIISLIIMAVMLQTFFSACSSNNIKEATGQETTGATSTEPAVEEPVALNIVNVTFRHSDTNTDNFIIHYIENKTNTKLNITAAPSEQSEEKLNLQLASGDRPDIIQYGNDETEYKLAEADMLIALNKYFDKMPNLQGSREKRTWDAMTHKDGNIYAVPPVSITSEFATLYRKDWLDKFGIAIPQTIDEYYAAAEAVSNQDPDGNSTKDTYAFGGRGSLSSYFDHVFGAYGCLPNYWMLKDGQVVSGSIDPGAKEALKFLNKMYSAGMIDPEFTTDNSSRLKEKVNKGRFGAFNYGIYILDTTNIYNNYQPFMDGNPDAQLVRGPLLKGPSGNSFGYRNNVSIRGWVKTSILKETKNLDACIRLFEYLASDEGEILMNYGIENEHYAVDGNGIIRNLADADQLKLLGINECMLLTNEMILHTSKLFQDTVKALADQSVVDPTGGMTIPELSKYSGDLKDITNTAFLKMITGEIAIEGGFETYVQEWKTSGGDELTKAVNTEYQNKKK